VALDLTNPIVVAVQEKERQEKKAKKEEKRRKKAARDGSLSEVKDDDAESEKAVIMDFIDSLSGTVSIEASTLLYRLGALHRLHLTHHLVTAPDVEEEDTPEKRNELATTLAHEQFESLTRSGPLHLSLPLAVAANRRDLMTP
jgi:hypothetical protein